MEYNPITTTLLIQLDLLYEHAVATGDTAEADRLAAEIDKLIARL